MFDYTKIHIFEKHGYELPISFQGKYKIIIPSEYGDDAKFMILTTPDGSLGGYHRISAGGRFTVKDFISTGSFDSGYSSDFDTLRTINGMIANAEFNADGSTYTVQTTVISGTYASSDSSTENTIDDISDVSFPSDFDEDWTYPSVLISSKLNFDKVSTELVETQTLFFLVESTDSSGNVTFVPLREYAASSEECRAWIDEFQMVLYIDNTNQSDFRFFYTDGDDIVWTDRMILDFTSSDDSAFRINIGFRGENEGVYEESLYINILDTQNTDDTDDDIIYTVGSIVMTAETEGEDERYRALFTNFGLPHPSTFLNVYKSYDDKEESVDNVFMNEQSKKMFLTYSEIFPYVGSYKALINAVDMLGYDDIFFKEWYKEVGRVTQNGSYVAYDLTYKSDKLANTIKNISLEERIKLKKLNWLSMMYHLNSETDDAIDRFGFPTTKNETYYRNEESIVKLISLKKWLEKYVIGLNCRIVDIGGEGLYFERYSMPTIGSYQQNIEYTKTGHLSPYVNEENHYYLKDSSCDIEVNIGISSGSITIEDLSDYTFSDYTDGYIDTLNAKYTPLNTAATDNSTLIYISDPIGALNVLDSYSIKASSNIESLRFTTDNYIESGYPGIIIDNNEISFDNKDLKDMFPNSVFKYSTLPIFTIEDAVLYTADGSVAFTISRCTDDSSTKNFIVKNANDVIVYQSDDYINLIPPLGCTVASDSSYGRDFKIITLTYGKTSGNTSRYTTIYGFDPKKHNNHAILSSGVLIKDFDQTSMGLRVAPHKTFGTIGFYIIGYQPMSTSSIFGGNEYFIDIKNGNITFDDRDNGKTTYVNFEYNEETGHNDITMNVTYYKENIKPIYYTQGFYDFNIYTSYQRFMTSYLYDIENSMSINELQSIRVFSSGDYDIGVYGIDAQNGTYFTQTLNNVNVSYTVSEPYILANVSNSNNEFSEDGSALSYDASTIEDVTDMVDDFAILNYTNELVIGTLPDSSCCINDRHQYIYQNPPEENDYFRLYNASDIFTIGGYESIYDTFSESGLEMFHIILNPPSTRNYDSYLPTKSNVLTSTGISLTTTNPMELLEAAGSDSSLGVKSNGIYTKGNKLEVNAIFYNTLGECPVMQIPGYMIADSIISGNNTDIQYHLYIYDDIRRYYRWIRSKTSTDTKNSLTFVKDGYKYSAITVKDPSNNHKYSMDKSFSDEYVHSYIPRGLGDSTIYDNVNILDIINDKNMVVRIMPTWKAQLSTSNILYETNFTLIPYAANQNLYKFRTEQGDVVKISAVLGNNSVSQACYKTLTSNIGELVLDGKTPIVNFLKSTNSDIYVSYPAEAYLDYDFEISDINGSTLYTEQNSDSNKIFSYVDRRYSYKTRPFNVNNALTNWMSSSWDSDNLTYVPKIVSSTFYRYDDCPVTVDSSNSAVIIAYDNTDEQNVSIRWDVYRRLDDEHSSDFLFTCYNNNLSMEPSIPGIYDVIMTLYDQNGNKCVRNLDGIIEVK